MQRAAWAWARRVAAVGILAIVVQRLGTGPFLSGLRSLSPPVLLAALGLTVVTTVCAAVRWRAVVHGLGGSLSLGTAVLAYYRSQFLNSALPGGVVGDVHRGLRHGRDDGSVGRGVRAVVWERVAGQAVFVVLAAVVLVTLDSPVRTAAGWAVTVLAVLIGAAVLVPGTALRRDLGWLLSPRTWPLVTVTSLVVAAGHTAVFLLALAATHSAAPLTAQLPLAVLVLLAMTVPLSLGGWGPREGVAAWAFAAAGFGAASGVAAATAYGVLAFVATLPGALVLIMEWLGGRTPARELVVAEAAS
jgi:uncharacterized membrane protein YbhN (UPF0104 family)